MRLSLIIYTYIYVYVYIYETLPYMNKRSTLKYIYIYTYETLPYIYINIFIYIYMRLSVILIRHPPHIYIYIRIYVWDSPLHIHIYIYETLPDIDQRSTLINIYVYTWGSRLYVYRRDCPGDSLFRAYARALVSVGLFPGYFFKYIGPLCISKMHTYKKM